MGVLLGTLSRKFDVSTTKTNQNAIFSYHWVSRNETTNNLKTVRSLPIFTCLSAIFSVELTTLASVYGWGGGCLFIGKLEDSCKWHYCFLFAILHSSVFNIPNEISSWRSFTRLLVVTSWYHFYHLIFVHSSNPRSLIYLLIN